MLQRTKNGDLSRLSIVPLSDEQARKDPGPMAEPIQPDTARPSQPETRAPEAVPPSAKAKLVAALKSNRKLILQGVGALALFGAGWFAYDYLTAGRYIVSTDDAYIRADATTLGAKVSGYVAAI